jgi:SAM-dependent methyltransferase
MADLEEAMAVIERAQADESAVTEDVLSDAIEEIVRTTGDTYTRQSASYAEAREAQPWEWDSYIEGVLLALVRSRIASGRLNCPARKWRLLDVGAGYGRDVLRLAKASDIEPVALENSIGFIKALRRLQDEGALSPQGVIHADMRDMASVPDRSFQCVRNHATLHHLPVVPYGLGADAAVAEARRVLVRGGVFYVLVKEGEGVELIDTGEGLGGRFYQLFTRDVLAELISRHSFSMVHLEEGIEPRASGDVAWLFGLAIAL